jgi:anti-anti-sigma factor
MAAEGPAGEPSAPGPGADGTAGGAGDHAAHGGIEIRSEGDTVSVRFWGAVDLSVRLAATTELRHVGHDLSTLALDCRDVTFMDSTGLSVLVRVVRDAAADGRPVRLVGAAPSVRGLLETTGVDRWMDSQGVVRAP